MASDYITEQEFRDYINSTGTDNSDSIEGAITAASRAVDSHCGRFFYQENETQFFSADPGDWTTLWLLPLDDMDLATLNGIVVVSETDNSGTYPTTWTAGTHFIGEPVNQSVAGITGWPYTHLRAITTRTWPYRYLGWQRDTIQITGTFGWPAVPEPVKQATKIIANQFYKLASAPLGVAGYGAFGDIKVRDIPQASTLLIPYVKAQSAVGIA